VNMRQPVADLVICRCEGIRAGEIDHAITRIGCKDVNAIKKITRAGMGPCQGIVCHRVVALELARLVNSESASVPHTFRPPIRPVPLARLGAWAQDVSEPAGTVDADVVWKVKAGARGTISLPPSSPQEGEQE